MYFRQRTPLDLLTWPALLLSAAAFALFLFSGVLSCAYAESAESPAGISSSLDTPPAFSPQTGTKEEQPDCTVPANKSAHPMACSISTRKNPARSASLKKGYLDNQDITGTPDLRNDRQKTDKTPANPEKSEYDWDIAVELRDSPVLEETGNATRNESKGALIKGKLRF